MVKFEGTLAGATWGEKGGVIRRVHFITNTRKPNGHVHIEGVGLVPVKAIFVKETQVTAGETPNLENARKSWGDFKPIGDFKIPLPPLLQ